MNPLIKDEISRLRKSETPLAPSLATAIEMLCGQDETLAAIKEQTIRTNGRVTKHDADLATIYTRLETLEKPAGEFRTLWNSGKAFAAIIVAAAGVVAGFAGSFSGAAAVQPDKEAIKAAVTAAIEQQKALTPPAKAN